MSAPVDVLAVMADVRGAAGDYDAERLQGIAAGDVFDEARAAVAELVEAAKEANRTIGMASVLSNELGLIAIKDHYRLSAALARVGGAA